MSRNSTVKNDHVVVIGAGASGLAAANALRGRGIQVRIIDRASRAGDAWYHRHPQLRLNTHRLLSALPGLSIRKTAGAFPSRDNIIRYLDEYAQRLDAPIDYGVEVTRINRSRSGWIITTNKGDYHARHVVVATGYAQLPVMPAWKGCENFNKPLIHAANLGDLANYHKRKILVVGAGNSGTDILNHLASIETEKVWVSVRHGPVIFPVRLFGIPMQLLSPLFAVMPVRVADAMLALTEFIAFGSLKKWGLRKHPQGGITRLLDSGTAPAIDNGFVASLKTGKTTVVPAIERFGTSTVHLSDQQTIEPDIVIAATGYRTGLQSILGHIDVLDDSGVPKIHGDEQMEAYPGLWFTGMQPRLTGFFQLAGSTARKIARAIDGNLDKQLEGAPVKAFDILVEKPSAPNKPIILAPNFIKSTI
jgi:cation diffusion facilitator CzcD-associated flavoprotein CzcO